MELLLEFVVVRLPLVLVLDGGGSRKEELVTVGAAMEDEDDEDDEEGSMKRVELNMLRDRDCDVVELLGAS